MKDEANRTNIKLLLQALLVGICTGVVVGLFRFGIEKTSGFWLYLFQLAHQNPLWFIAIIIGFNVRPTPQAKQQAELESVQIRLHRIIYKAIEEIETAMKGMLDPEYEEKITGQMVVRETYKVSKVGTIAGCYVLEGSIKRDSGVRVIRDGIVIYTGELGSLKRFKDDVKEVSAGYDCGLNVNGFNDIKINDVIESYTIVEIKRTL